MENKHLGEWGADNPNGGCGRGVVPGGDGGWLGGVGTDKRKKVGRAQCRPGNFGRWRATLAEVGSW
ncbi:MAG: hypothetical protein ACK5WY_05235 [Holosporaceae bacterium]|nr:hypothetical protein [Rhodospirillaceae bacterium]